MLPVQILHLIQSEEDFALGHRPNSVQFGGQLTGFLDGSDLSMPMPCSFWSTVAVEPLILLASQLKLSSYLWASYFMSWLYSRLLIMVLQALCFSMGLSQGRTLPWGIGQTLCSLEDNWLTLWRNLGCICHAMLYLVHSGCRAVDSVSLATKVV